MQSSIKSHFLTTQQSSSYKSYFVKKKKIEITRSKQAKEYFQSPKYQQHSFETIDKNLSTITVDFDDPIPSKNGKIKFNKISLPNSGFSTQQTSQFQQKNNKQLINKNFKSDTNDIFNRQRSSQSLLETLNQKRNKNKNINFLTISDNNCKKSLTQKQILIQDPTINPQNITILPKIQKNTSQKLKNLISQRIQKFNLYRNNSMISKKDPYHILSKQIADKFSIQKFNDYKKLWNNKQKKRKQINLTAKNSHLYKSFSFNASIIDKSFLKSNDITLNYNKDVQNRQQKCYWEEELRGHKRRYVTIGQISNQVQGLKGHGQKQLENILIKPTFSLGKNNFLCEQVYKYHK